MGAPVDGERVRDVRRCDCDCRRHQRQVSGTASGSATAPTFSGSATVTGSIHVVSPVELDIPLDGVVPAAATMTLVKVGCTEVEGTFIPSFNETVNDLVVFSGTVTWTGSRAA